MPERLEQEIMRNIQEALEEDIGEGDATATLINPEKMGSATIMTREQAILCGNDWAQACFKRIDPHCRIHWLAKEGDRIKPDFVFCRIEGHLCSLLTAERTAINFLQMLSGTATCTRQFVDAVKGTGAKIFDTRKTLPGLRMAQKHAVRIGGGNNQRMGLYDGILIKENHISAAGSIRAALLQASGSSLPVQIEVESLAEMEVALDCGARLILLDNFMPEALREAVTLNRRRAILEASGGITLDNVHEIALSGIDRISVGHLTKDIHAIDLSMRLEN